MKAGSGKSCPSCGDRYDADVLFCPKDGTPLASPRNPSLTSIPSSDRDPYVGIELPGQIRIDTLIGIGSMGRVYRAFQGGIDRDVAVKILHRELSGNPELTGRFHREAKVASRLVHPNVVQVLMTGTLRSGEDARAGGELYLVMEFLDGISLLSALAAAGTSGESAALPLPRALHVALQICDAVGEAHAQGIVHRDLKPENVMLVRRGDDPDYVKVLDFGIARLDWADRGLATQAGLIFGTAKYISPEGAEGQPVGPAADVYSIATILYQMLGGRTPFDGDSPVALLVQHTHAPPMDLRSIARASYVPAPLAATIMANLAKKPAERAQTARLFARDLVAAARASGLYPEEFATQSTLFSPASFGAVKLASRERTRAHELSAELAAKIGGVAASQVPLPSPSNPGGSPTPGPTVIAERAGQRMMSPTLPASPDDLAHASSPHAGSPHPGYPYVTRVIPRGGESDEHEPVDERELLPEPTLHDDVGLRAVPSARPSQPTASQPAASLSAGALPRPAPSRPGASRPPELPDSLPPPSLGHPPHHAGGATMVDDGTNSTMPGTPLGSEQLGSLPPASGSLTTMQGTETTLLEAPPTPIRLAARQRARMIRVAALVAGVALVVPLAFFGARKAGVFGAAAPRDTLEGSLEEARDCMKRRAWDSFKSITDSAASRWPDSAAVTDLRHEAAGLLVSDALARKYDNDTVEAGRLADLALYFDPALTTAQRLSKELAAARVAEAAPPPPPPSADRAKPRRPVGTTQTPPDRGAARGAQPASTAVGTGTPASPPATPTGRPPGDPPPSSTGPWL